MTGTVYTALDRRRCFRSGPTCGTIPLAIAGLLQVVIGPANVAVTAISERLLAVTMSLAMAAAPGAPEAYEELMSVIVNVLRIFELVRGWSVVDKEPAVKAPVVVYAAWMQRSEDFKI